MTTDLARASLLRKEFDEVRKSKGGTIPFFKKAANAFARDPSALNWRALKRAMMYRQRVGYAAEFEEGLLDFDDQV